MKRSRLIPALCLLLAVWSSGAKSVPGTQVETITGEWETFGAVKMLYETPLGAVYKFKLSPPYLNRSGNLSGENGRREVSLTGGGIKPSDPDWRAWLKSAIYFNFLRKGEDNKRFVVLDYTIRPFPALDGRQKAAWRYQLLRSENTKITKDYKELNGILFLTPGSNTWLYSTYPLPRGGLGIKSMGENRALRFEPMKVRIIFDTKLGTVLRVLRNGIGITFVINAERPFSTAPRIEIRTFGICIQELNHAVDYRDEYFEISKPVVRMFDTDTLMRELPAMDYEPYPYEKFLNFTGDRKRKPYSVNDYNQIRRQPNPDFRYGGALAMLYGSEPASVENALKLLYSAETDIHIFALRELGICHWRGYGMPPAPERAQHYLRRVRAFRYSSGAALEALVFWRQAGRNLFLYSRTVNEMKERLTDQNQDFNDHDFNLIGQLFGCLTEFPLRTSPRSTLYFVHKYQEDNIARNTPEGWKVVPVAEFFAYAEEAGFRPAACWRGIRSLLRAEASGSRQEALDGIAHLRRGAAAGDWNARGLLLWHLLLRNELALKDLTAADQFFLSEDPIYHFVRYALENPDFPGMAAFRRGDLQSAAAQWRSGDTIGAMYLDFLVTWIWNRRLKPWFNPGWSGDAALFRKLETAASAGIPGAQYLLGSLIRRGDFPNAEKAQNFLGPDRGRIYLERALKNGFEMAGVVLVGNAARREFTAEEQFGYLEGACRRNYGPAWHLKGRLLLESGKTDEARAAFQTAAQAGEPRGFQELALLAEAEKDPAAARRHWFDYIRVDRQARFLDPTDLYVPEIEFHRWMPAGKQARGPLPLEIEFE